MVVKSVCDSRKCTYIPKETKKVKSHVCKYKSIKNYPQCEHPECGGDKCYRIKFNENYCDFDELYTCNYVDKLGWCRLQKENMKEMRFTFKDGEWNITVRKLQDDAILFYLDNIEKMLINII